MIKVLINDTFKKYLINQPIAVRNKIRQKFEFLEIGYWDGGLKVKKLRGTGKAKTVFEARLDQSNRILFTLGKEQANNASLTLVYVWGIVEHDDISRSRDLPTNAPFLYFKPYHEEKIEQTPLEEIQDSYISQESITQKVSDDSPAQKWHFLSDSEWDRFKEYQQNHFELPLYLSPKQQDVLDRPLPLLVSGTAGSGKTTLAISYLLKLQEAKGKKLFVTFNRFLKNEAHKLYHGLLNASPLRDEYRDPDFHTLKEYCLNLAAHYHQTYHPEAEVNFERFQEILRSFKKTNSFDTALIWEEIRSIIKGALPQINIDVLQKALHEIENGQTSTQLLDSLQQQFFIFSRMASLHKIDQLCQKYLQSDTLLFAKKLKGFVNTNPSYVLTILERSLNYLQKERELTRRKYLSFADYEALGKKKAPNFFFDRQEIYGLFEKYQDYLESNNLWDDLDLSRESMNLLKKDSANAFRYDLVVCDEVQDLTDVQHQLLFSIARSPLNMLLSGDSRQIINPSGFRWEELKRHFYERELRIPEILFLNLNFRSSGSIVELSNTLLDLKSQILGNRAEEVREDWKYKGRPPVVVTSLGEDIFLNNIRKTGARKTILVRSERDKNQLQKLLETELIFTISEAKGLEFETVLLWKFTNDKTTRDIWKSILDESRKEIHDAKIRHEINLLYVAITRAEKDLIIYDGPFPSGIWKSELFSDKVYFTDDPEFIGNTWNAISTPQEWKEQGDYFFERECYRAAMECYKNAGENQLHLHAQAQEAVKNNNHSKAAKCFRQLGELERAAVNFEKAKDFKQAAELYNRLKDKTGFKRCNMALMEQEGRFSELAEIYLKQKDYRSSFEMLLKATQYEKAAALKLKHFADWQTAADLFEKSGNYQNAAQLYEKNKQWEKAGEFYEKAGKTENAIKIYKKLELTDRLLPLYYLTENYEELLSIYENRNDLDKAIKVFQKNKNNINIKAKADSLFEKRKYFSALVRYAAIQDNAGTGRCYFRLKEYARAGLAFEKAGEFYEAGRAFAKSEHFRQALENYLKSPQDRKNEYILSRKIARRLNKQVVFELGIELFNKQEYEPASFCAICCDNYEWAGTAMLELKQYDRAKQYWKKILHNAMLVNDIADYCLRKTEIKFCAEFILEQPAQKYSQFYKYNYNDLNTGFALNAVMELYFKMFQDKDEQFKKWMQITEYFPIHEKIISHKLRLLELSKEYNMFYSYVRETSFFFPDMTRDIKKKWAKEIPQLLENVCETNAIKLYALDKVAEMNEMLKHLDINLTNYKLFRDSEKADQTIEYFVADRDLEPVKFILAKNEDFERLAKIFEEHYYLEDAAHYFGLCGNHKKSAYIYEKIGKLPKAGDAYFNAGNYTKALEIYEQSGRSNIKIAKTLEKLGQYRKAGELWKRIGKSKDAQRCLDKIQNKTLFD